MSVGPFPVSACAACGSINLSQLRAELSLHVPKNIDKPTLFTFLDVIICRDCGHGHFTVSPEKLNRWLNSAAQWSGILGDSAEG